MWKIACLGNNSLINTLILGLMTAVFCVSCGNQQPTARDLFYHELSSNQPGATGGNANASNGLSASYCLELVRGDAAPVMCDNRYNFKSGDRVRLRVKANAPVYAYVTVVGSSGKKEMLYPPSGEDNRLEAGVECLIPKKGMLQFDSTPGTEHLLLALSRDPVGEDRALQFVGVSLDANILSRQSGTAGFYGLTASAQSEPGKPASGDASVYINNPNASSPITIEIPLNHVGDNGEAVKKVRAFEIGYVPRYFLDDLAKRNPANRNYQATSDIMRSLSFGSADTFSRDLDERGIGDADRQMFDAKFMQVEPGDRARFEGDAAVGNTDIDKAYELTGIVRNFYKEVFNRNSIDGKGMTMLSTCDFDRNFENAYWNTKQMVYGHPDDSSVFSTYVLLDVIGHEITHGITQFEGGEWWGGQAGALNESVSDVFGELIKQWSTKTLAKDATWTVGEGVFKPQYHARGFRDLLHPGTACDDPRLPKDVQPLHMKDYIKTGDDNGGVHMNCSIPSRAFALFALDVGGYAWEEPGKIWYAGRAETGNYPCFANFAYHTIEAAKKLGFETDVPKLEKAWDAVGVVPSSTATDTLTPTAWVL